MSTALSQTDIAGARMDLSRVAEALEDLRAAQEQDPELWQKLGREPLSVDATRCLMDGYRYVDRLLIANVDLFGYSGARHLLQLNQLVLSGASPKTQALEAAHMEKAQCPSHVKRKGGIGGFIDWCRRHQIDLTEALAAGCYVQMVSRPQLFIEGNQRTALLVCTYVLVRRNLTPFIVTKQSFEAFTRLSDEIKAVRRNRLLGGLHLKRLRRRLIALFRQHRDPDFLYQ